MLTISHMHLWLCGGRRVQLPVGLPSCSLCHGEGHAGSLFERPDGGWIDEVRIVIGTGRSVSGKLTAQCTANVVSTTPSQHIIFKTVATQVTTWYTDAAARHANLQRISLVLEHTHKAGACRQGCGLWSDTCGLCCR